MFTTLMNFLRTTFRKETCAECGEKMTEATTVPINNGENICGNCYAKEMLKNSYDAYEIMHTIR